MKILILVLLLVFISGCGTGLISNEGSKYCEVDSDCVPMGMCTYGCFDKDDLPIDDGSRGECGMQPPSGCLCIDNYCTTEEWVETNGLPD
jgi:hypothetical protein